MRLYGGNWKQYHLYRQVRADGKVKYKGEWVDEADVDRAVAADA